MEFILKLLYKKLGEEKYFRKISSWYIRLIDKGFFKKHKEIHQLVNIIHNGDVCLEIGAKTGEYSVFMSSLTGMHGKVIASEASPFMASMWKINSKKSGQNNYHFFENLFDEEEKEIKIKSNIPIFYKSKKKHKEEFDAKSHGYKELINISDRYDFIKIDSYEDPYEIINQLKNVIIRDKPRIQINPSDKKDYLLKFFSEIDFIPHVIVKDILTPAGKEQIKNYNDDIYFIHRSKF